MSMNLGIKNDLVAKAGIPINPPLPIKEPNAYFKSHIFPIATLEKVEYVAEQVTKDRQTNEETTQPVIKFTYKDKQNPEKKITSIYYGIEADDEKWDIKLEGLQKSIKHIFEEIIGADKFDEKDFSGSTFAELFENSANAFNKVTYTLPIKKGEEENSTPVVVPFYTTVPIYIKLTYYNNRLGVPMYPNFIQRAFVSKPTGTTQLICELAVGKGDVIINKADAKPATGSARDNALGGAGAFGIADSAMGDMVFPD